MCFCTSCIKMYLERMQSKAQAFNHSSMQASESMYSYVQTRLADKCFSQFRTILYIIILIEVQLFIKGTQFLSTEGFHILMGISLFLIYAFNPFLFIRGLSCPSCIQASLSLNCLKPTKPGFPHNCLPISFGDIGFLKKS